MKFDSSFVGVYCGWLSVGKDQCSPPLYNWLLTDQKALMLDEGPSEVERLLREEKGFTDLRWTIGTIS